MISNRLESARRKGPKAPAFQRLTWHYLTGFSKARNEASSPIVSADLFVVSGGDAGEGGAETRGYGAAKD